MLFQNRFRAKRERLREHANAFYQTAKARFWPWLLFVRRIGSKTEWLLQLVVRVLHLEKRFLLPRSVFRKGVEGMSLKFKAKIWSYSCHLRSELLLTQCVFEAASEPRGSDLENILTPFIREPRPESGLGCLICGELDRKRSGFCNSLHASSMLGNAFCSPRPSSEPLPNKYGTHKTVKARFWTRRCS